MNQMTPEFLKKARQVFTNNAGISLLDVRAAVAGLPASTKRRDALSALDSVQRLFGRDLRTVPANWLALRILFQSQNAAQLGVSEKRFANIRSEVIKAVKSFGAGQPALTKRIALAPEWTKLLASVPQKSYGHALNRLASFCSVMGISPQNVDAETLLAFYEALVAEEVIKDPRKVLKFTTSHWNMCRNRVPGWPDIRLSSPFPSSRYMLELSEFPVSFQADIAKWRRRLLEPDALSDDGPDIVLRPITVNCQEKLLRRFATALIERRFNKVEEITSLSTLLEVETLKEGLRFFLKRANNKPTDYIRKYAWLLLSVARHHAKLPIDQVEAIKKVLGRLGHREIGMTKRNRERLAQFDEEKNFLKLLKFPEEERKRGLKIKNPYRRAKAFERALSAAILIYASVRMQNLRTIQIGKNIRYHRDACILSFDKTETKNKRPLELELPEGVAHLLQEFIQHHRPILPGSDGPYLFPGKSGGPRSHNTMRHDFETAVFKHTGLRVNPHLMRHATAMLAINDDPANLPMVAQRLGHSNLQTARNFYLGNESRPSSRVMNKILEEAANRPINRRKRS
jgi:integrase